VTRPWNRPTPATSWAIAAAIALTCGTTAYLAQMYSDLPHTLPVQYLRDEPFIFEAKSPTVVLLPVMVQAALLTVFGTVILLLLWRSDSGVDARSAEREADHARMRLAAEGIALLAALWTAVQAVGAVRLMAMWQGTWNSFGPIYPVVVGVAVACSVMVIVRTMRLVGRERRHSRPDTPGLWRLRALYFNPHDPALFVQTRHGGGWTLNFGRSVAILVLAAALLLGIGGPFVLVRFVLHGFAL
jgi:uncharacterized membrane protein